MIVWVNPSRVSNVSRTASSGSLMMNARNARNAAPSTKPNSDCRSLPNFDVSRQFGATQSSMVFVRTRSALPVAASAPGNPAGIAAGSCLIRLVILGCPAPNTAAGLQIAPDALIGRGQGGCRIGAEFDCGARGGGRGHRVRVDPVPGRDTSHIGQGLADPPVGVGQGLGLEAFGQLDRLTDPPIGVGQGLGLEAFGQLYRLADPPIGVGQGLGL